MHSIFKYPLAVSHEQKVVMPSDAKILSVQRQGTALCLWARVTPNAAKHERIIRIFGTGHDIEADYGGRFIGTVQYDSLVWHIFEDAQ